MGAVCTTSSREIAEVRLAIAANHAPQGLGSLGGGGGNAEPAEPRACSATSGGLRRRLAAGGAAGGTAGGAPPAAPPWPWRTAWRTASTREPNLCPSGLTKLTSEPR